MKMIVFTILFLSGCADISLQDPVLQDVLLHEEDEAQLLTEAEFMSRVSQSAAIINDGLLEIQGAVEKYAADNGGSMPSGKHEEIKSLLLDGGYIERWPTVPPFAFTDHQAEHELRFSRRFEDLDGRGAFDDVVFVQDLKL